MNEFELIATWFEELGSDRDDVRLGVGDDAALIALAPDRELVTAGACAVAGDDARASEPEQIASCCYEQALQRLCRQQATPAWAVLCLCLAQADSGWLQRFSSTLHACLRRQRVQLIGGDTTRGPTAATLFLSGTRSRPAG